MLLLYDGALHVAYAEPRVQLLLEPHIPGTQRAPRPVGDAREELREAERRFERSLELAPDSTEARIRLAHVRGLRDRHEEAADALRCVAGREIGGPMQYYAWLLLGREETALGRRDAARGAFERAMDLYPGAQSPRLGLSLLARTEGDHAAARSALEVLRDGARGEEDPWWSFNWRHAPDADELLGEMRRRLAP